MTKITAPKGVKKRIKGVNKWAHVPVGTTIVISGKNGKPVTMVKRPDGKMVLAKGNQSGGRTEGTRNINTKITDLLREVLMTKKFKVQGGNGEEMLAVDALVESLVRRAISKSDLLLMEILNRVDGKVGGEPNTAQPIQAVQEVIQHGDRGEIRPILPDKET